jgi:hypothetical protein
MPTVCDRCGRAENPLSPLTWFCQDGIAYCGHCYRPPELVSVQPVDTTVITCPTCCKDTKPDCRICTGLGVVRVSTNAIPMWTPG